MFSLVKSLFSLEKFSHRTLFDSLTYPWQVLEILPSYLRQVLSSSKREEGGRVHERAHLEKRELIFLDEGAIVEAGAYIRGPCIVGKGSVIRHGAYLRGEIIVGSNCVIGHGTEVKGSILLNEVEASHFAYIGDSILGNGVLLGAGFRCANVRLDRGEIHLFLNEKGEKIASGHRKLGLFAGDGARLGCNGVSNPGTLLGKGVQVAPLLNIGGYLSAHKQVTTHPPYGKESLISIDGAK